MRKIVEIRADGKGRISGKTAILCINEDLDFDIIGNGKIMRFRYFGAGRWVASPTDGKIVEISKVQLLYEFAKMAVMSNKGD